MPVCPRKGIPPVFLPEFFLIQEQKEEGVGAVQIIKPFEANW